VTLTSNLKPGSYNLSVFVSTDQINWLKAQSTSQLVLTQPFTADVSENVITSYAGMNKMTLIGAGLRELATDKQLHI
jgi:hypothetical protein